MALEAAALKNGIARRGAGQETVSGTDSTDDASVGARHIDGDDI